jgi:integrase
MAGRRRRPGQRRRRQASHRITVTTAPQTAPPLPAHSAVAVRKHRKHHKPFRVEKVGSTAVPIYRERPNYYRIAYYEGGKCKKAGRVDLAEAIAFAKQKATDMATGEHYRAGMTGKDRATLECVRENLLATGVSPELATADYAMQICKIKSANLPTSLSQIVDEHLERESRTKIIPINCPDLVDQYLEARRLNTFGKRRAGDEWLKTLGSQLKYFAKYFNCPLSHVSAITIERWLDFMKVKGPTRKGYRTAVACLMSYAKAKNFQHRDWNELEFVTIPQADDPKKQIISPDDLLKLLHCAQTHQFRGEFIYQKLIPLIVLSAFAGIRHQEVNPASTKQPLDWRNIDFKHRIIRVPKTVAKTKDFRVIHMTRQLAKWLLPYARPEGAIREDMGETTNSLCRLKARAGISIVRGETKNCLRKSWETYSEALKQDRELVAGEAGHSQAVMKRHYLEETGTIEDAERWFKITLRDTLKIIYLKAAA